MCADIFAGFDDGSYVQYRSTIDANATWHDYGVSLIPDSSTLAESITVRRYRRVPTNVTAYDYSLALPAPCSAGPSGGSHDTSGLAVPCDADMRPYNTSGCMLDYSLDYADGSLDAPYRCAAYDTVSRSWYTEGLLQRRWTTPYVYFQIDELGMDAVQPLYNPSGELIGVGGSSVLRVAISSKRQLLVVLGNTVVCTRYHSSEW